VLSASLASAEGVTDGNTQAGDTAREKLSVVFDEIKMPFGADKEIASGIELDAASDMPGKVIDGGVVGAGIKVAVQVLTIETGAESAQTSLEFEVSMVGYLGCVYGINVEKDRTIGLITSPFALGRFPVDFASDADVMEDLHVTTKTGISASIE
jgi:hypothetical protein